MSEQALRDVIQQKYGEAATRAATGEAKTAGCCGTSCGCGDPITSNLYGADETTGLPDAAVAASLGCGNPTALIDLHEGETVLDLGSGGGIDVLLSARRVGPAGKVYGLDMTDEMLELAERNRAEAGVENVRFLKGEIENIPLPENAVDVVISNCVINLSADKDRVLAETFRVLRPGGRFAVSDIVIQGELPAEIRSSLESWTGCVAGALTEDEYRAKLAAVGFTEIDLEVTRVHSLDSCSVNEPGFEAQLSVLDGSTGRAVSAFVRARKPA